MPDPSQFLATYGLIPCASIARCNLIRASDGHQSIKNIITIYRITLIFDDQMLKSHSLFIGLCKIISKKLSVHPIRNEYQCRIDDFQEDNLTADGNIQFTLWTAALDKKI